MSAILDRCEKMAKKLPLRERARLIEGLVKTLDEIDESECEELWLAEAEQRYEAYKDGKIPAKSAEDTLQAVRVKLEKLK